MQVLRSAWLVGLGVCLLGVSSERAGATSCLADPVNISPNVVVSPFGKERNLPHYNGVPHKHWGVDFRAKGGNNPKGAADIIAADSGTILGAGFWGSGYGNRVILKRENGDLLVYSHLASIEPKLRSGGAAVGFKDTGTAAAGTQRVSVGEKLGVAGGTAGHAEKDSLPIHLHLEYVTGVSGTKVREAYAPSAEVKSRYLRNPLEYACKAYQHTADAMPVTQPSGGKTPPEPAANAKIPTSAAQADAAKKAQPSVTTKERYGTGDAPPADGYAGMAETQIVDVEANRRWLDTMWAESLTAMDNRAIWVEIAQMEALSIYLEQVNSQKRASIEAMLAARLSKKVGDTLGRDVVRQSADLAAFAARKKVQ